MSAGPSVDLPDADHGCDEHDGGLVEATALHLGPLVPLVRTVAWHVMNNHNGTPTECGLDFKYQNLPTPQDATRPRRDPA